MAHHLVTFGTFDRIETVRQEDGKTVVIRKSGTLNQLHGMLGHIDRVDWHNATAAEQGQAEPEAVGVGSKENLYRRFLLFKEFYANETPVIVCEGKTDYVYLREAIRRSATQYPLLASVAPNGAVSLNVRLFQYPSTSTGRILGLAGGAGDLKNVIDLYKRESPRFTAPGEKHPFIVLLDNDDGAKSVVSLAQQLAKTKTARTDSFVKLFKNCYVVLTPVPAGAQSSTIEDSFAKATRDTVINGKRFSAENNYDATTHYGKAEFSRFVQENAAAIDFAGFKEVLSRLSAVVAIHKNTTAANTP